MFKMMTRTMAMFIAFMIFMLFAPMASAAKSPCGLVETNAGDLKIPGKTLIPASTCGPIDALIQAGLPAALFSSLERNTGELVSKASDMTKLTDRAFYIDAELFSAQTQTKAARVIVSSQAKTSPVPPPTPSSHSVDEHPLSAEAKCEAGTLTFAVMDRCRKEHETETAQEYAKRFADEQARVAIQMDLWNAKHKKPEPIPKQGSAAMTKIDLPAVNTISFILILFLCGSYIIIRLQPEAPKTAHISISDALGERTTWQQKQEQIRFKLGWRYPHIRYAHLYSPDQIPSSLLKSL